MVRYWAPRKQIGHMARNSDKNSSDPVRSERPDVAPVTVDYDREISYTEAEALGQGEIVEGRYLGADLVPGKHKPQLRHHLEIPLADGSVLKRILWGSSALDMMLSEADLGRMTFIRHDGYQLDRKTGRLKQKFAYTVKQGGPVTKDGLIGRPPVPGSAPADGRR